MSVIDLGKVRGSSIYTGSLITGSSTIPSVFETGIGKAYAGDIYLNTDDQAVSNGNIYECTEPGAEAEAKWIFKGNIRGPKIKTVDNLKSLSVEDALAAHQGKVLFDLLLEAGVLARNFTIECDQIAYGLRLNIDNVNSDFTIKVDGKDYVYKYTASGSAERTTISISLGSGIGMNKNGGIVSEVRSSAAYIYKCDLTNDMASVIYTKRANLWEEINKNTSSHEVTGTIVDGAETISSGPINKFVNNMKRVFYPITHAKAVWMDKTKKETVFDAVNNKIVIREGEEQRNISLVFKVTGTISVPTVDKDIVVSPMMGLKIIN